MAERKKATVLKAWGGFLDDKLDTYIIADGYPSPVKTPAVFLSRDATRERYCDVRRVEITIRELPKGKDHG